MAGETVVRIEHRGWERFGEAGSDRRNLNNHGWSRDPAIRGNVQAGRRQVPAKAR